MKQWRIDPTEENFRGVVVAYAGVKFKTYSGLSFSYEIKKGRNGAYTKELWIDRCDFCIYGMFYRFGLIDVPDEVKEKIGHPKKRKK